MAFIDNKYFRILSVRILSARIGSSCFAVPLWLMVIYGGLLGWPGIVHSAADQTEPAAFLWNKELAEQGDVAAQYNLGMMCEIGLGVPVDDAKAVKWYSLAAEQGHAKAQLKLGLFYYSGLGAQQSEIRALKWLGQAAKNGNPVAAQIQQRVISDKPPEGLDISKLMTTLQKALLESEDSALQALEQSLTSARQVQREKTRAAEEKTIRQRRIQREASGAGEGINGSAVEKITSNVPGFLADATLQKNKTQAMDDAETLRLQAEKGMPGAQYSLGRVYEMGGKLPMDKALAVQWYRAAAKQGYAAAEYRMALACLYGVGVERDERLGRRWLKLAADHGHKVAENMWEHYSNTTENARAPISVAVNWYMERAFEGDKEAQLRLGTIYEKGWGVAASSSEAQKWYTLAKQQGSKEAEEHLIKLDATRTRQVQ